MKQLKFFIWNAFYNLNIAFRIKQAIFFTVFFPVLIFVVFSFLWGNSQQEYIFYLLTGVICMTLATDGFFVIGAVLKQYYESDFMKYINKLPTPISLYFFSLVISRFVIIILEILILCILASVIFELNILNYHLNNLIVGALLGMIIFSFLGLCIHFIDIKNKGGEKGLINFVYFILLFTSDSFYPACFPTKRLCRPGSRSVTF